MSHLNSRVTGELTGGGLTNTAPGITAFNTALTGNAGYNITLAASAPTVAGTEAGAGTGGSLTMEATTATAAAGNSATIAPVSSTQVLNTTGVTIDAAAVGAGNGLVGLAGTGRSRRPAAHAVARALAPRTGRSPRGRSARAAAAADASGTRPRLPRPSRSP